ncbi:hypothetical protein LX36DRAFT_664261 [Colletotrichum falcatum]|nr:hypothetical protein LX36DRAFT_664261 [Colletotrichum falcatum]
MSASPSYYLCPPKRTVSKLTMPLIPPLFLNKRFSLVDIPHVGACTDGDYCLSAATITPRNSLAQSMPWREPLLNPGPVSLPSVSLHPRCPSCWSPLRAHLGWTIPASILPSIHCALRIGSTLPFLMSIPNHGRLIGRLSKICDGSDTWTTSCSEGEWSKKHMDGGPATYTRNTSAFGDYGPWSGSTRSPGVLLDFPVWRRSRSRPQSSDTRSPAA